MSRLSNLAVKAARKAAQAAEKRAVAVEQTAARAAIPARPAPPRVQLDAYHGTPFRLKPENRIRHKITGKEAFTEKPADQLPFAVDLVESLPLGRFRTDKIGSGTGAQLYGHGIYLSDTPQVARSYRHGMENPRINGEDAFNLYNQIQKQADSASISEGRPLYDRLTLLEDLIGQGDTLAIRQNAEKDAYSPEVMDWFQREVEPTFNASGALYHTKINTSRPELLGWNSLLADQPLAMERLAPLLQKYELNDSLNIDPIANLYPDTGGDLYHKMRMRVENKNPELLAKELVGANIPGIRYTDYGAGLNNADAENYVMMNPDLIDIIKRYRDGGNVHEGNY